MAATNALFESVGLAWKMVTPTGSQSKEKTFEGKAYIHCPFHSEVKWVLKSGHSEGCRLDPAINPTTAPPPAIAPTTTTGATDPARRTTLQYARALMHAIEAGAGGDAEILEEEV